MIVYRYKKIYWYNVVTVGAKLREKYTASSKQLNILTSYGNEDFIYCRNLKKKLCKYSYIYIIVITNASNSCASNCKHQADHYILCVKICYIRIFVEVFIFHVTFQEQVQHKDHSSKTFSHTGT